MGEFWRRWHITLGAWLKERIYIPLGGSNRYLLNILIVFLFSGLWHGAGTNFVFWGLLNGLFIIFERYFYRYIKVPGIFKTLITFSLIYSSWFLFKTTSLSLLFEQIKNLNMKGINDLYLIIDQIKQYTSFDFKISLFFIFLVIWGDVIASRFNLIQFFFKINFFIRSFIYIFLFLFILMWGVFNNEEFIYFQF